MFILNLIYKQNDIIMKIYTTINEFKQNLVIKNLTNDLQKNLNMYINESKHDKSYKKDVAKYKFFIIDIKNKKALSGWEFKEDAQDALSDYDGDKNFKIVPESGLKKLGIENPKDKWINENNINDNDGIFKFDVKPPFDLPNTILDYYVSRKDGNIGTAKWDDFHNLLKNNIGVKFGSYAYSQKIYVLEMLEDGRILRAEYDIVKV